MQRVAGSLAQTMGRRPQLIPNSGGGLPGDVFVDYLNVPLVWIPHSYNGCKQHGPDEHLLLGPRRGRGWRRSPGIWWDLGEGVSNRPHHGLEQAVMGRRAQRLYTTSRQVCIILRLTNTKLTLS